MPKFGVLSLVACVSALDKQGPGAFVSGFAEGLLGANSTVDDCGSGFHKVAIDGMMAAQDMSSGNVSKAFDDIGDLLMTFRSSISDCKAAAHEMKQFLMVLDGVHEPGDLYTKIKTNYIDNDEEILNAFEGAGRYCTFAEPDGHKCGMSLGRPLRLMLLGETAILELGADGVAPFFAGFADGLMGGEADGVKHCAKDLDEVADSGISLANAVLQDDVNKTVVALQSVLLAFRGSVVDCKDAAGELKPFLSVLSGVRSPGDLYQKLKQNALDGDESIIGAFEGAGKYCTFKEPNGRECGKSIGSPVRLLLLGPNSTSVVV